MRALLHPLAGLLLAACGVTGCATGGPDVFGRSVTLVPASPDVPKASGELLAVDQGRIWLRTKKDGVREFESGSFREVRVERHGMGKGLARRVGLIGGLVSTIALTAACSSVEGNDAGGCLAVGASVGGLFAVTGLLSSTSLDATALAHVAPQDLTLRGYARFPAGLPKEWLMQEPKTSQPAARRSSE